MTGANATAALGLQPSYLHHILIQEPLDAAPVLSDIVSENIGRLKQLYPGAEQRLWGHEALRDFIAREMTGDVLAAFDRLRPFAYKADLGRLCLLHIMGGLYSDLSFFFINPILPPDHVGIVAFQDVRSSSRRWASISNGLLWATPGRPELAIAIEMIVANCRDLYYGSSSIHPTGPVLMGRAFAQALVQAKDDAAMDGQWVGETRLLTPLARLQNVSYFTPHQELIAVSRKRGGTGLVDLALEGCNNYNDFWHKRTVYGEDMTPPEGPDQP